MNGKKEDSFFIPKKLAVGFNKRSDTYTGKIGYVIYYDAMNKLRKEASWNSWRERIERKVLWQRKTVMTPVVSQFWKVLRQSGRDRVCI